VKPTSASFVRRLTHGHCSLRRQTRAYSVWAQMKARCNNPKHPSFKNYGGRGIKVLWDSFESFYQDMGNPPVGLWIERKDNNGNYCKDNCRWATPAEQLRNKRGNRVLTVQGTTGCMVDLCELFGIKIATAYQRFSKGWSVEEVFLKPVERHFREHPKEASNGV
jgi:hypothetical protein